MIIKKGKIVTLNKEGLEFAKNFREERPFVLKSTPTVDGQIREDTEFIVDGQSGNVVHLKYKDDPITMTGFDIRFIQE